MKKKEIKKNLNISNNKNAINEELRDKWVLMEKKHLIIKIR